jgi:hypothetical protein
MISKYLMTFYTFLKDKYDSFKVIYPFWSLYCFFVYLNLRLSKYYLPFLLELWGFNLEKTDIKLLQYFICVFLMFIFLHVSMALINFIFNTTIFQFFLVSLFTFFNIIFYFQEKLHPIILRLLAFFFGILPAIGLFVNSERFLGLIIPNMDYVVFLLFLLNTFISFNNIVLIPFLSPHLIFLKFYKKKKISWIDICELIKHGFQKQPVFCSVTNQFYSSTFSIKNKINYWFFSGFFLYFPLRESDFQRLVKIDTLFQKEYDHFVNNIVNKTLEPGKGVEQYQQAIYIRNIEVDAVSSKVKKQAIDTIKLLSFHSKQGLFLGFLVSLLILNLHLF